MDKGEKVSINLYTTFYIDKNEERHNEYLNCIRKNLDNEDIVRIVFLIEENVEIPFDNSKIEIQYVKSRPTYSEFIKAINSITTDLEFNIIAVTDIYFDKSIRYLKKINWEDNKTAVCLTRWDVLNHEECRFFNKYYSNDTWIFKGKVEQIDARFYLGQPGCDNRFNFDLLMAGYRILNPSLSIVTYHLHVSAIRSYVSNPSNHPRTEKPYLFLLPDFLNGIEEKRYELKKKLYRNIRYELNKEIVFNRIDKDEFLQISKNKFVAFIRCIYFFNYSRKSLLNIVFKTKDISTN